MHADASISFNFFSSLHRYFVKLGTARSLELSVPKISKREKTLERALEILAANLILRLQGSPAKTELELLKIIQKAFGYGSAEEKTIGKKLKVIYGGARPGA